MVAVHFRNDGGCVISGERLIDAAEQGVEFFPVVGLRARQVSDVIRGALRFSRNPDRILYFVLAREQHEKASRTENRDFHPGF